MCNPKIAWMRGVVLVALGGLLAACVTDRPEPADSQRQLQAMSADLDQKRYDQVVAASEAYLRAGARGSDSSMALYLRGRAFEDRTSANAREAEYNMNQARAAYMQALQQGPTPRLEAYIRASLANVAYFQEDYATAMHHWLSAYDHLDQEELKAWALYRAGICQQRLGQFVDADRTFAQVQRRHAGSIPAQRSAERQGARSFYVQLATFRNETSIRRAYDQLAAQGMSAQRITDSRGYHILRVGPVSTYAEAKRLRQRFIGQYDDALIVP